MCNLYTKYHKEIINKLLLKFKYKSIMQVPKLTKIVLSMGLGSSNQKNNIQNAIDDLTKIAGQKPIITIAHKSIATFKIRKNSPIGCKVTLRKAKMWYFYDKFIFIAIPRIRDFRGFKINSFDKHGNYNLGIKEQIIFPEIDYNLVDKIRGLNINFCTNAINNKEAFYLLYMLDFPFKK